nr:GxGYxYP domain-containing protein [Carbonactinospora thermoautotrophica]
MASTSRRCFLALALSAGASAGVPAPAAAEPAQGVVWPESQALPWFSPPERLDVLDLVAAGPDEQILAASLQGSVNRRRPRIYLLQPSSEGPETWLRTLGVPYEQAPDLYALVARYRAELRGLVVPDPAVPATRNLATTFAGLHDALVAAPAHLERLTSPPYSLPVLADLRGRFADNAAAYAWAVAELWPRATHRMLVGLDHAGFHGYLREYAVANRAFVWWGNPAVAAERTLLGRLLADLPPNSPYLGWWPADVAGESDGTELVSRHSGYVVAADWSLNLSVFGGVRAPVRPEQPPLPVPPLRDRVYVTFTVTDGDNLQYNQHRMRVLWDDPARGQVPLNWTISPLLLDAGPAMLAYYQRTATAADLLVAGPSGAGYAYPTPWPDETFRAFTRQTGRYMRLTGLRIVNVLNRVGRRDVDPTPAEMRALAADVQPLGIMLHWTNRYGTSVVAGVPVVTGRLVFTAEEARAVLAQAAASPRRPLFVSIGVLAWTMTPADVAAVAAELDERYAVVRGDQFFALLRRAHGLAPT